MKNRISANYACPSSNEWLSLVARELPAARIAEMETHLEVCLLCAATMDSLSPRFDDLADALRKTEATPIGSNDNWRRWADIRFYDQKDQRQENGNLLPFERKGMYQSRGLIGKGGMGEVYKAWEVKLDREVAVKMLPSFALLSPEARSNLKQEARRQAKLEHPNIIRVYSADDDDGIPYFSMELVAGGWTLAKRIREGRLNTRTAAELVRSIAMAIHYAHSTGILHLDLKPANVLLTTDGTPKVADFGLASSLGVQSAIDRPIGVGTDEYMSPEQWMGDNEKLGEGSDVYGLGAILFELLYGRPPFLRSVDRAETRRQVLFDEPKPPTDLRNKIHRDLESICMKCLQKRPEDRYSSALEVSEKLDLYLKGYPIDHANLLTRGLYLVRRRRVGAIALCASVLFFLGLSSLLASVRWQQQLSDARTAFTQGQNWASEGRITEGLTQMNGALESLPFGERKWRRFFQQSIGRWSSRFCKQLDSLTHSTEISAAAVSSDGRYVLFGDIFGNTFLWDLSKGTTRRMHRNGEKTGMISAVAFNRSGTLCAAGGDDSKVTVWEVATGEIEAECPLNHFLRVVAFIDDQTQLVTATGDPKNPLRRWKIANRTLQEETIAATVSYQYTIDKIIASPDAGRFLSISSSNQCILWDSKTGQCLADLTNLGNPGTISSRACAAFSKDGARLLIADIGLTFYDAQTGGAPQKLDMGSISTVYAAEFRGDSGISLVMNSGKSSFVRHGKTDLKGWNDFSLDYIRDRSEVMMMTDRELVLTRHGTRTIRLVQPPIVDRVQVDLGSDLLSFARIAASHDASRVVTVVQHGLPPFDTIPQEMPVRRPAKKPELQIWDGHTLQPLGPPVVLPDELVANAVAYCPTSDAIAIGCRGSASRSGNGVVLIGTLGTDGDINIRELGAHMLDIKAVAFSPDGKKLVTSSTNYFDSPAEVVCWDFETAQELWRLSYPVTMSAITTSPRNDVIALAGTDGTVRILSLSRPELRPLIFDTGGKTTNLDFSRDGKYLAVAQLSGRFKVLEISDTTPSIKMRFEGIGASPSVVAFDQSEETLYVQAALGIQRWDTDVWEQSGPLISFDDPLTVTLAGPSSLISISTKGKLLVQRLTGAP